MPYNAYLQASQRHYELALSKAPGDAYLRCKYARVLIIHGNYEQMKGLINDEQAHLQLAGRLQKKAADAYEAGRGESIVVAKANKARKPEQTKVAIDAARNKLYLAKTAYADALNEVGRAIDLAPFDASARNRYAYYTWQWYWGALRFDSWGRYWDAALLTSLGGTPGPNQDHRDIAMDSAKWAVHITEDKGPRSSHGTY